MDKQHKARFGTKLGDGPGNVPVYSSDYPSASKEELPEREAYRSYVDGHFMGYKWQCVELARRWLYVNKGYVFDDIAMAYDIFRLRDVSVIADGTRLPLKSFANGSRRRPEPGCLLIWNEGGEFDVTGHVAVVTEVFDDKVRVIEQNVEDKVWADGHTWSRELAANIDSEGGYWIDCTYENAGIMGWVIQTDDATHAEIIEDPDPRLFDLGLGEITVENLPSSDWLDPDVPEDAAYMAVMNGSRLTQCPDDAGKYFMISETALAEVTRATNELHAMFMHATNYVLRNEELLRRFNLPPALWPRIHQSWGNRSNEMITGRFDFAVSAKGGIKVYEYNCDSASCHMETGKVQSLWAVNAHCHVGRCPGDKLYPLLVKAWREVEVGGLLHIMQDRDNEETYHALFMQRAIAEAGLTSKIIKGISSLKWGTDGEVLDADGLSINWVWKTWAWETALDQIRDQIADDEENLRLRKTIDRSTMAPRLVDVLLRPKVMVFEPLWSLIPSNKAILPVLWMLYPNHPYLLESHFELTTSLRSAGYVAKPIVGRCGQNISLFDHNNKLLDETTGGFDDRDQVYQALSPLPVIDGKNVQVCSFSADGVYAGACVRTDTSKIITTSSDILPLRVVEDAAFL